MVVVIEFNAGELVGSMPTSTPMWPRVSTLSGATAEDHGPVRPAG